MPSITYLPAGTRVDCAAGESVFEVARRAGINVTTACVGKATCGLCRVKVIAGEQHLSPFNAAERKHLGNVYFINKLRLSCQARLGAGEADVDVVVELPAVQA
ncbi:MAG TPA: 2Fe-2S iron-sulfur cluster-binding protein [Polyangia bacterium]|nr:2Fe-2S iron-sulfur cluster-binding protein [Polyangia bacterium]